MNAAFRDIERECPGLLAVLSAADQCVCSRSGFAALRLFHCCDVEPSHCSLRFTTFIVSPRVRDITESGIQKMFLMLESGIQRLESGIQNGMESGIYKLWNPRNPYEMPGQLESRIQRLGSGITGH